MLLARGGQSDKKIEIVLLRVTGALRGTVAYACAAHLAFVRYNVAAPRIRLGKERAHPAAAGILSIARHHVNVKRIKAKGAMITRGIAKRLDLAAAMGADEARVIF